MSLSLRLDGNIFIQLTDEAQPFPVPLKVVLSYMEKIIYDFSHTTTQTNAVIPQGSITAPKFVLVFVREGTINLSWDSAGAGSTSFTADPQTPANVPVMFLYRGTATAAQLYLSSTGVARGAIWLFE